MLQAINTTTYVPTLGLLPGEIKAIAELPDVDKNQVLPLFLLAPWGVSEQLENSISVIEKAFPNRPYFLDIDWRYHSDATRAAVQDFDLIRSGKDGYSAWIDFIQKHENAIPCIQTADTSTEAIAQQISAFESLGRGMMFRFETERRYRIDEIVQIVSVIEHDDFCILVDSGWQTSAIEAEALTDRIAQHFDRVKIEVPLIVSSTSFPREFSDITGRKALNIISRTSFANLKLKHNQRRLIYGDWGSTRPRRRSGGAVPIPRIDFPTKAAWIIARDKDSGWSYSDAALAIIASEEWKTKPQVWGAYMIENTAKGDPHAITNARRNTAARINIHLHMQTNFDSNIPVINTDQVLKDSDLI